MESSSSGRGRSHHGSEKRMNNFSRTPKPRFEMAFCTGSGRAGVNFITLWCKHPNGIVTITESAWKVSFVVDTNVIELLFEESISMDVMFVRNLMISCDNAGCAMYCTIGSYVESKNGLSPY